MRIETSRLVLVPHAEDEWIAVANGDRRGRTWAEDYPTDGDALLASLALIGRAPAPTDDQPWGPLQVRERATNKAIGGAGFKGPPDDDGCVEIGYGLAPSARGKGYATEAVQALVALAHERGIACVLAETHVGNTASERVLERGGFAVTTRGAELTYWRLDPTRG